MVHNYLVFFSREVFFLSDQLITNHHFPPWSWVENDSEGVLIVLIIIWTAVYFVAYKHTEEKALLIIHRAAA